MTNEATDICWKDDVSTGEGSATTKRLEVPDGRDRYFVMFGGTAVI